MIRLLDKDKSLFITYEKHVGSAFVEDKGKILKKISILNKVWHVRFEKIECHELYLTKMNSDKGVCKRKNMFQIECTITNVKK